MSPQNVLPALQPRLTRGASCLPLGEASWRLAIPAGPAGRYRLAQLDDYRRLARNSFPWNPPLSLSLRARASTPNLPGTWGFGLWNDPFAFPLGLGGGARGLPCLPNAAWFFFASPQNYLSLRDDLPASGNLAAVFSAPRLPSVLLAPALLAAPLLFMRPLARLARRLARRLVPQQAAALELDASQPHEYALRWETGRVTFSLNGRRVLASPLSPAAPLGLVLWVDNQYAAFRPGGRLAYGFLPNPQPAWIELTGLKLSVG
ncbi:MAG: hypothetical protein PHD58_04200 [Anaerolineales bacterium]|nr:hypothetical protein [Anaerolineales bacterium]